jgi:hypothetical protein
MTKRLLFVTRPRTVHVFCEHLSPVGESGCNPRPKSVRQTGRYPFIAGHNDLANDKIPRGSTAGFLPVSIHGKTAHWTLDTGANFSMISEEEVSC